jgi:hypothetical protein
MYKKTWCISGPREIPFAGMPPDVISRQKKDRLLEEEPV